MRRPVIPEVEELLRDLHEGMATVLRDELHGLYVYGSLASGDFTPDVSDVDLLAVTASELLPDRIRELGEMHEGLVAKHGRWSDRIDVAYASVAALKTYRWRTSSIAVISPGEPLHEKQAGRDWLINWYVVREHGVALRGPSPKVLLDPISKEEFVDAVKVQAGWWRAHVDEMRSLPQQAYSILTMCRALYASRNGEQVSKEKAAAWAEQELPDWASFIQDASRWRRTWRSEPYVDPEATFPMTRRLVHLLVSLVSPDDEVF